MFSGSKIQINSHNWTSFLSRNRMLLLRQSCSTQQINGHTGPTTLLKSHQKRKVPAQMRIAAELSNTLSSLRVRFINNIICNKMHYFIDRFAWPGPRAFLAARRVSSTSGAPAWGERVGINTRGNDRPLATGNLTTKFEWQVPARKGNLH